MWNPTLELHLPEDTDPSHPTKDQQLDICDNTISLQFWKNFQVTQKAINKKPF